MINRVVLIGRTTADCVEKKTQSGISSCRFTLAVDRRKKADGADFIAVQAWRQTAEFLGQYCKKGDLLGIDGRLTTYKYEKDGRTIYVTEVIADDVRRLSGKREEVTTEKDLASKAVEIDPDELPF